MGDQGLVGAYGVQAMQQGLRQRLIERWLTDELGLDWATANEEAHRLEHAVSPVVEERIAASMGYPDTCPHGNPIRPLTDEERAKFEGMINSFYWDDFLPKVARGAVCPRTSARSANTFSPYGTGPAFGKGPRGIDIRYRWRRHQGQYVRAAGETGDDTKVAALGDRL